MLNILHGLKFLLYRYLLKIDLISIVQQLSQTVISSQHFSQKCSEFANVAQLNYICKVFMQISYAFAERF